MKTNSVKMDSIRTNSSMVIKKTVSKLIFLAQKQTNETNTRLIFHRGSGAIASMPQSVSFHFSHRGALYEGKP